MRPTNENKSIKPKPARRNCRHYGKFTGRLKSRQTPGPKKYCDSVCRGLHYRGKSRDDRTRPSKKVYIQIRLDDGRREYWHRYVYRQEHGPIPEGFIVHHKNEIKRDNGPGNLATLPRNEHTPNEHFHWRTRDWQSPDEFVPLDPDDEPFPF